jgi:hypothetical protein
MPERNNSSDESRNMLDNALNFGFTFAAAVVGILAASDGRFDVAALACAAGAGIQISSRNVLGTVAFGVCAMAASGAHTSTLSQQSLFRQRSYSLTTPLSDITLSFGSKPR